MILANATYDNSKQYLSFVAGLRPIANQWREKFNNKERDIGLTDDNNLLMGLLGSSVSSGSLMKMEMEKTYFKELNKPRSFIGLSIFS